MRRVLIVGAGGHGQVVADILIAALRHGAADRPVGFVDDDRGLLGKTILGLPVLGGLEDIAGVPREAVVVAIGQNALRRRLFLSLRERGVQFANAVHPRATVAPDVRLGAGVVVCAGAVVNTGSVIGDAAILNTGCTVDHHNQVGAFAHLAPGTHLGGMVSVGEGALVGIGCSVIPGRTIGEWATVRAGAAVTTDIPPYCTAVGVPARVIKRQQAHGLEV